MLEISRAPPFCLILSRFHGKESRRLRPTISFPPPPPPPSQFEFELALFHDVEKDFLRLFPRTTWKEFLSSVFERGGCNEFEKLLVIGRVYMILVIHLPRGTGFLSE